MSSIGPRLLILSAPSGAGKTTLAQRLLTQIAGARLSVSTTTRAPRGQERDGLDYHFVDEDRFRALIANGDFLEWAEVHGHLYGTRRGLVAATPPGSWTVFDIDVTGGAGAEGQFAGAVTLFVLPPSLAVREARLRGRQTESEDAIARRLAASFRDEIARGLASYDYAIVNHDLELATRDARWRWCARRSSRAGGLRAGARGSPLASAGLGRAARPSEKKDGY